jgi:hypothetical protein
MYAAGSPVVRRHSAQISGTAERGVWETIFPVTEGTQGECDTPVGESDSRRQADKRFAGRVQDEHKIKKASLDAIPESAYYLPKTGKFLLLLVNVAHFSINITMSRRMFHFYAGKTKSDLSKMNRQVSK